MQFPRRNTLTLFAIALALVCFLEMAPSARADCLKGQLAEKAKGICSPFLNFLPCGIIVDQVVGIFNSVCDSANVKDISSSSTTTATTVAPKA
ncbi:uncharacterized protein Dvir_GJ26319 [Drosophila virilis]|uniref:Uncharacterized protein n=1 Tax=Drosophila virilis TaxID=7244 RepID=A0A0Q9WN60_DROVI|nr:uncharacterized protein Dvir_GJ26319 [Drosophila virilis]